MGVDSFPTEEGYPNEQLHISDHSFPSNDNIDYCIDNNQLL